MDEKFDGLMPDTIKYETIKIKKDLIQICITYFSTSLIIFINLTIGLLRIFTSSVSNFTLLFSDILTRHFVFFFVTSKA